MRAFSLQKHRLVWPVLFLFLAGCNTAPKPLSVVGFPGNIMGTTYSVKVAGKDVPDYDAFGKEIKATLDAVNNLMSTWEAESDLSRFNAHQSEEPFPVDPMTAEVLRSALDIASKTGGALDPTITPLVELWGFGKERDTKIPPREEIDALRATVGYQYLTVTNTSISKLNPSIQLNLNANAKGFAVDKVSEMLLSKGYDNFLVEVGGEIRVSGDGPRGTGWRLAIADPNEGIADRFYTVVDPLGKAMATSGNYRNFFVIEDKTYHHIIDPRTGWPAEDLVVSATVFAPDCNTADALATALIVLNPAEGMALIESMPDVECLLLLKAETENGALQERESSGFSAHRIE